jgi:RNA polymerase sigma-70 factor (ECF subfamily)
MSTTALAATPLGRVPELQDRAVWNEFFGHVCAILVAKPGLDLDWFDAEDVVQEVWLKLVSRPALFDASRGQFRSLFVVAALRRATDLVRARRREASVSYDEDGALRERLCAKHNFGGRPVDPDNFERVLKSAVAGLTGLQRSALALYLFEELDCATIARVLDATPEQIRDRVRDGMAALRKCLRLVPEVRDLAASIETLEARKRPGSGAGCDGGSEE